MSTYVINSLAVCPDRNKVYPKVVSAKGVYLYDENGKEYLDAVSGKAAVANIGHGNEMIADTVGEQMKKLSVLPTYCFESPLLDQYLQKLVAYSPPGFTSAWLVTSGSEAVENACKLAYQYHTLMGQPDRHKFIGRQSSYHGNSIFGLDVGGIKHRKDLYRPLLKGYPQIPPAHCYRCPFQLTRDRCGLQCAQSLEQLILREGAETIAGFIVEPVSGAALGAAPAPDGYLQEIRRICDQYGILMIADEVMTGFGRTGYNFAVDHWGVIPDIIASGKGIGSGYYPLAAVIAHEKVMAPFAKDNIPFAALYSYACNPLGAVVGNCVIDFMLNNNINAHVQQVGLYLFKLLSALRKHAIVGDVRGMGLQLAIEFVADGELRLPFPEELRVSYKFADLALENGLVVYPCRGAVDGHRGDHILLTPPLILTAQEAEKLAALLDKSIADLTAYLATVTALSYM